MPDQYDFMAPVINNARKNAVVNPEDFKDSDGLLVCGKCGKRKQKLITLTRNGAEVPMVVPVMCKCKSDAYKQQKARDEQEKEMEAISKLRKDSLMDSRFRSISFKNFVLNQYNEKCFRLCKRYATAFDKMMEKNMGLLMYGGVGTGKTFAAACIANYLLDQKIPVVMISFIKLLEMLEKNTDNDIIQNLQSAKLLVLDDLGAERMPFVELAVLAGLIHISQNLITQHYRPLLVVGTRKKLDHLPPNFFEIFISFFEFSSWPILHSEIPIPTTIKGFDSISECF